MRTITVTEKYKAVQEGSLAKSEFVRQMRQSYPMYVSPVSDYNSTVQILKNRSLLFEAKEEVDDSFKYSDDSLRRAIDIELEAAGLMSHQSVSGEDQAKAKKKAIENLKKDPLHYYHLIAGQSSKVDKHDKEAETKRGAGDVDTFNGLKKATLKEGHPAHADGTPKSNDEMTDDERENFYNYLDSVDEKMSDAEMDTIKNYTPGSDTSDIPTEYKPGDMFNTDFDYEGMLKAGLKIRLNTPVETMQAIFDSFEDVNYHREGEHLSYVIDAKEEGAREEALTHLKEFRKAIKQTLGEIFEGVFPIREREEGYVSRADRKIQEAIPTMELKLEAPSTSIKTTMKEGVVNLYNKYGKDPGFGQMLKDFFKMHGSDLDAGADIEDEFEEYYNANTNSLEEAEPLDTTAAYKNDDDTQDMIDKMRKDGKDADDFVKEDFPPSPNTHLPEFGNGEDFDVATAFKKARVDMSKPVAVMYHYGHAQYSGEDTDVMSAEAAIKKLEAERQEVRKNYTDDGEEVPSDRHGYEFENYSVLEEHMPEGHEYKLSYYLDGDYTYAITQEKSGVSELKVNEEDSLEAFSDTIQVVGYPKTVEDALKVIERYERDRDPVSREEAKDLVAGMRATDDDAFDRNITNLIVKAFNIKLKGISEKKGKDHDGDGDIDGDDYMASKDKAIKKAMGKNEIVKENLKAIISKVLEEQVIAEAATAQLSKLGDDYEGFDGMKASINGLENIVTDIEQYFDKTRQKIQKIYDTLGEIRNEEGLKVGGFLAPAIEQAFMKDLKPAISQGFTKGLNQPKVKTVSKANYPMSDIEEGPEEPKQTVFTPVHESKKKKQ